MDTIDRVDRLVRQNIIKHTELKHQQRYQTQLNHFKKQSRRQALKSYAQTVKEGNLKAIQKTKNKLKIDKKYKYAKAQQMKLDQDKYECSQNPIQVQNKKVKMNEQEIKKVQEAIVERAERILQEKELERINVCLAEQRKKTKLHELSNRCRKLAKCNIQIEQGIIPEERKRILEEFESKAMEQIEELDKMIQNIVEKGGKGGKGGKGVNNEMMKNNKQGIRRTVSASHKLEVQHKIHINQEELKTQIIQNKKEYGVQIEPFLNNPLFFKSTQELLSMDYIPI